MSNSLWPNGLQYSRLPCPSLSSWVCTNSCPLSQWCHPAISSPVVPSFFCPQFFPASGIFSLSWLLASGSQSTGTSESVLPVNIQGWFPLGLTGLISLLFKGLSRVFSSTTVQKYSSVFSLLYGPTLTSIREYWKNHGFDYMDLCQQSDSFYILLLLDFSEILFYMY